MVDANLAASSRETLFLAWLNFLSLLFSFTGFSSNVTVLNYDLELPRLVCCWRIRSLFLFPPLSRAAAACLLLENTLFFYFLFFLVRV